MRMKSVVVTLLLSVAGVFAFFGIAGAQEFRAGNRTTVAQGEVIDSTLWATGSTVDIAGEVNGDVFCAGQNVTITGTVRGDVICAGQNVRIAGAVEGDVRVAGQVVMIEAKIDDNLTAASQNFTLSSEGSVEGDASIASNDAMINGAIARDLAVTSTSTTITSTIGRNVKAGIENLSFTSNARVGGSVEYASDNEASVAEGAQIGSITRTQSKGDRDGFLTISFGMVVYIIIALLLVSIVLVLFAPNMFESAAKRTANRPWKTLFVGLAAGIIVPAMFIALLFSVIGIPLAIIGLHAWLLVLFLGGPFVGYLIGRLLLRDQNNAIVIMLLGSLLLLVTMFIPIFGFFVLLVTMWMGAGMILYEIKDKLPKPRYRLK